MPPLSRVPDGDRGCPAAGPGRARDRCTGEPKRLITPRVCFFRKFCSLSRFVLLLISFPAGNPSRACPSARAGGSLPFSGLGDEGHFPKCFVKRGLFFCFSECFGGSRGDGLGATGDWSLLSAGRARTGHPRRLRAGHGLKGHPKPVNPAASGDETAATGSVPSAGAVTATATRTAKNKPPKTREIKYPKG